MEQPYASYAENLKNHIRSNVNALLKEPRSFIHYPFIDPGSVYDGNVWDWDTYWSVYGLLGMMDSLILPFKKKFSSTPEEMSRISWTISFPTATFL